MSSEGRRLVFMGTVLLGLRVEGEGREPGALPWPHLDLGRQGLVRNGVPGEGRTQMTRVIDSEDTTDNRDKGTEPWVRIRRQDTSLVLGKESLQGWSQEQHTEGTGRVVFRTDETLPAKVLSEALILCQTAT